MAQRALISQDRSRESYPPGEDGARTATQRAHYGGGRRGTETENSAVQLIRGTETALDTEAPIMLVSGFLGARDEIRKAVGSLKTLPKAAVWRRGWTQERTGLRRGDWTQERGLDSGRDWTQERGLDSGEGTGLERGLDLGVDWTRERTGLGRGLYSGQGTGSGERTGLRRGLDSGEGTGLRRGLDSGERTGLRGGDWTQGRGLNSGEGTELRRGDWTQERGLDSREELDLGGDWTQESGLGSRVGWLASLVCGVTVQRDRAGFLGRVERGEDSLDRHPGTGVSEAREGRRVSRRRCRGQGTIQVPRALRRSALVPSSCSLLERWPWRDLQLWTALSSLWEVTRAGEE